MLVPLEKALRSVKFYKPGSFWDQGTNRWCTWRCEYKVTKCKEIRIYATSLYNVDTLMLKPYQLMYDQYHKNSRKKHIIIPIKQKWN